MHGKKLYLVIAAAVALAVVVAGGLIVLSQRATTQAPVAQTQQQVLTLSPEAVGLEIAFRADKKAMKFTLSKASDIKAVEYEISYTKEIKGEQVPDGLIGDVDINPGDSTVGIGFREFGTCSSGVCRYDTVVSPVMLTLKITKTDNKVYQVTKTVSIPQ